MWYGNQHLNKKLETVKKSKKIKIKRCMVLDLVIKMLSKTPLIMVWPKLSTSQNAFHDRITRWLSLTSYDRMCYRNGHLD